jgi:hypothetical protein
MQALAKQYAQLKANNPALAEQIAQALGFNIHAAPNVGEAYESSQLGLPTNLQYGPEPDFEADSAGNIPMHAATSPGRHVPTRDHWENHIGAVVAMSEGNRVTLENYARTHELGTMRRGPDYYFQMYGPATIPNQTWHYAWTQGAVTANLPPIKNAVTNVVRA